MKIVDYKIISTRNDMHELRKLIKKKTKNGWTAICNMTYYMGKLSQPMVKFK